jgi:competence protein ComEA
LFKLTPKEQKLLILLVCLLALGLLLRFILPGHEKSLTAKSAGTASEALSLERQEVEKEEAEESPKGEDAPADAIIVHITGAVKNPGVYSLPKGARVFHAVEEAGGALEEADLERINLAQHLYDGQPVYVPRKGEEGSSQPAGLTSYQADTAIGNKVNINTASKSQLETLPGIGSVKAQNIINYRQKNGPFQSIEDLVKVSGIGDKTLEGIRELITVY